MFAVDNSNNNNNNSDTNKSTNTKSSNKNSQHKRNNSSRRLVDVELRIVGLGSLTLWVLIIKYAF